MAKEAIKGNATSEETRMPTKIIVRLLQQVHEGTFNNTVRANGDLTDWSETMVEVLRGHVLRKQCSYS